MLDSAMQAYQALRHPLKMGLAQMGASEPRRGQADIDLNQLVELLLLARATHAAGEHATGERLFRFLLRAFEA